jgi:hypothetical protein
MSITVADVRSRLASGTARKSISFAEESMYGRDVTMPGAAARSVVKSWWVGVDALTSDGHEDGCLGGWRIDWYQFENTRRLAMEVSVFADGLAALMATGVMEVLLTLGDEPTPQQVRDLFAGLGFEDTTPRSKETSWVR